MLLWFQCTSVTRSVSSDSAVIDDLGCAAYSSSTDCVSSQMKQWLVSLDLHLISPSADDV